MSSETNSSSFCLLIFLLSVFSSFCHSQSLIVHLCSYYFILVPWNSPGSLLSPFYCLFIFLSFCLSSSYFVFSSSQIILGHWRSSQFFQSHFPSFGSLQSYKCGIGMVGLSSLVIGPLRAPLVPINENSNTDIKLPWHFLLSSSVSARGIS